MFSTLYLLKYNNYYNRIVKKEDSLEAYAPYIVGTCAATNFKLNDGLMTNHIVNIDDDTVFDYAILADPYGNINSRWFVIESDWQRKGQYNVSLYRDTIVDFYEDILNAPCFIEKATPAANSPFIFNNENMAFNQIKTNEYLLKDRSGCAWLVGYYAKDSTDINGTVFTNNMLDLNYIPLNIPTIEDWEYYNLTTNEMIGPAQNATYNFKAAMGPALTPSYFQFKVNEKSANTERTQITSTTTQLQSSQIFTENQMKTLFLNYGMERLDPTPYSGAVNKIVVNDLLQYQGTLVKTEGGAYYEVTITSNTRTNTISINSGALFNSLAAILQGAGFYGTPNTTTFTYTFTSTYYSVVLKERKDIETTYAIPTQKLITTDAPWNIFAIPYGEVTVKGIEGGDIVTSAELGINLASAINAQHQSKVFDIQLLPYFPLQELITGDREIFVRNDYQYSIVEGPLNTKVGVIFNIPLSNFTFDITSVSIPVATSALEKKVNNECDKWRLCSPNYSNYFDFSAEKNGGVSFFNVDCNYKPYSPYIHINPNFSGLYGQDFNDPRGLVLGGDFSISQIGDAWKQYEIQNKNYQLSFDRQIQNMEFNNSVQRTTDIVSAITGITGGAMSGAIMGSIFPGVGTLVGGFAGGVASAGAGVADIFINEALRNEALDYTKDLFGYQLGNIQALPQTLSKITAINPNNKIFPVLEYYTSTEEEKIAFANKLAYNGMTIMVIGKIKDYIDNSWSYDYIDESGVPATITNKGYIKGQIIRLEDLAQEYHFAKAIAKEISLGIYI